MLLMQWQESDLKRVLDYLRQKAELFKEVRSRFNIGDELGLASMPECHYSFSPGSLEYVALRYGFPHVNCLYPVPGTHRMIIKATEIPSERIVVGPSYSARGEAHLASIYFAPGIMENQTGINLDEKFFEASDEVFSGLIAHECAEFLLHVRGENITPDWQKFLAEKITARKKYFEPLLRQTIEYLAGQCRADILAASCGCEKEIIALLRFTIDRYLERESLDSPWALPYRTPQEVAEEFRIRLAVLTKS